MADEKKPKQVIDATLSGKLELDHIEVAPIPAPAAPVPVAAPPLAAPPVAPAAVPHASPPGPDIIANLKELLGVQLAEIKEDMEAVRLILEGDGQSGGLKTTVLLMAQKLDAVIDNSKWWKRTWVGTAVGIVGAIVIYLLTTYGGAATLSAIIYGF